MTSFDEPCCILHLGLGSFHRAHQAAYLQRLRDSGDAAWGLAGGNVRPDAPDTIEALRRQGGYTLETVAPTGERDYQWITAISPVVPWQPGLAGLIHLGSEPATRIVSFTVTEAGYYLDAAGRLDSANADIVADLETAAAGQAGSTVYGALTAILRERIRRNAGPVTLLSCDNLRHNGARSRGGLEQFISQLGDAALLDWVLANTTCPNAMVDRITPRPTMELRDRVRVATGRDDGAPVMSERFTQWVIEDRFCAGRPRWESAGVEMVGDVAPYEEAKIRLLNATHSVFAWAGALLGRVFIHESAADPSLRALAFEYATDDAIPCLRNSPMDLGRYRDTVLDRFCNAALADTNQRVAADSYAKLQAFVAATVRDRLRNGDAIAGVALLPALFLAFLQKWGRGDVPWRYEDAALAPEAARRLYAAADPVAALCADAMLWGECAGDERLVAAVRGAAERVVALCMHG